MRCLPFVCLLVLGLVVAGCGRGEVVAAPTKPSYIYIVMNDNDVPHVDFDGDSIVKETRVSYGQRSPRDYDFRLLAQDVQPGDGFGVGFDFRLITMDVPPGEAFVGGGINDDLKNHSIKFDGRIVRFRDDAMALYGRLVSKTPVVVRYVKMLRKGANDRNEFPEDSYPPGEHTIRFEGTITGWQRAGSN